MSFLSKLISFLGFYSWFLWPLLFSYLIELSIILEVIYFNDIFSKIILPYFTIEAMISKLLMLKIVSILRLLFSLSLVISLINIFVVLLIVWIWFLIIFLLIYSTLHKLMTFLPYISQFLLKLRESTSQKLATSLFAHALYKLKTLLWLRLFLLFVLLFNELKVVFLFFLIFNIFLFY